jgi:tmRNA-binding protein
MFKVKIGVARGKKLWDKKEEIKKKDIMRDVKRDLNL